MTTNLLYVLIPVLMVQESGNNPQAIGESGEVGVLQIRQCVVDDVNRIYGSSWKLHHCKSPVISKEICYAYLSYWGEKYRTETAKKPTYEIYARIWNGGPDGWKKDRTTDYWKEVEVRLLEK